VHVFDDSLHQYEHRESEIEFCELDGRVPEQESHGLTMTQASLDAIRREREELNLLWADGRIKTKCTGIPNTIWILARADEQRKSATGLRE
jgi:hypothetical protein